MKLPGRPRNLPGAARRAPTAALDAARRAQAKIASYAVTPPPHGGATLAPRQGHGAPGAAGLPGAGAQGAGAGSVAGAPAGGAPDVAAVRATGERTLPRMVLVLATLAAGWLVIAGTKELQDILAPTLLTLNLMIVAYPVQRWLVGKGLPRMVGALTSAFIVLLILVAFIGSLAWSFVLLVQEVPKYQGEFMGLYDSALGQLHKMGVNESQLLNQLQQISPSNVIGLARNAFSSVTSMFSLLVVIVTILVVLVIDSLNLPERMQIADDFQPALVRAMRDFGQGVRRYWVVSSIFGIIVAVLDVGVLWWLGVPLALVWGLLSFLTNYIPNIGFVIGIIPPVLMALLANGPTTALIVFAAYCVLNFVIQTLIMPKFNGDAVGVTATVSLLSLLFWAYVLGPLGALLSLPATLLVKAVLIDADPESRWMNAFLASDPYTAREPAPGYPGSDSPPPDADDSDGADSGASTGEGAGAGAVASGADATPRREAQNAASKGPVERA